MVKDFVMASLLAGYRAVMVQVLERAGKEMHAGKPEILMRFHYLNASNLNLRDYHRGMYLPMGSRPSVILAIPQLLAGSI